MVLLPLPPNGGTLKVFLPPEEALPLPQSVIIQQQQALQQPMAVVCPPPPTPAPLICPAPPPAPIPDWGTEFNKIGQYMVIIQNLLASNTPDEALVQINNLRTKYPTFTYLRFLEASAYIVKRNFSRARPILEQALKNFPDDALGQQMLRDLDGSISTPK